MFSQFIAPIEIEVESEALPRSLDCAARRAKLRRGGKNRAAPLPSASLRAGGITEGGSSLRSREARRICHVCHPDRNGRPFPPFAPRERRPCSGGTVARYQTQLRFRCMRDHSRTGAVRSFSLGSLLHYINSAAASAKIRVCRSISPAVVSGHISAMLWNGVSSTPRFSA